MHSVEKRSAHKCNSMFDTHVAYTLKMEQNGLPPRLIKYEDLHRNIVDTDIGQLYSYMKVYIVCNLVLQIGCLNLAINVINFIS